MYKNLCFSAELENERTYVVIYERLGNTIAPIVFIKAPKYLYGNVASRGRALLLPCKKGIVKELPMMHVAQWTCRRTENQGKNK